MTFFAFFASSWFNPPKERFRLRRNITPVLYALIAVGVLAGLFAASKRYSVEQKNRRVELALEYTEVKQLAQLSGQPFDSVLQRFKSAGATSLAITEDTIASLESQGELHVQQWSGVGPTITVSRPEVFARIRDGLKAKGLAVDDKRSSEQDTYFEADTDEDEAPDNKEPEGFAVHADYTTLRPLGIGLDPAAVEVTMKAGLQPVGRIANFPAVNPDRMRTVLAAVKAQGVETVIFQGLEVLGYRGEEKAAAEALQNAGLQYGQVEFGKQKGDEKLGAALKGEFVRVHSIGEGEMGTLDENEAIDRFVRAARERNIRLCYIRLLTTAGFPAAGYDPIASNADKFLRKISEGIARGHEMSFGPAHLYDDTGAPSAVFDVIALGVAAGLTLLLIRVAPVSDRAAWLTLVIGGLVCVGAVMALGDTGRRLVALLAALVFPTLACLRRDVLAGEGEPPTPLNRSAAAISAIRGLIAASAVTSLGIVSVVGLLASRTFIVKVNQFLGIKAAHAVPIVIIGLIAIAGLPALNRPLGEEWARIRARIQAFLSEPTRVGPLLIALIALAALTLIVARTGNDPGVGVSGVELKFRALLDRFLPVRPRTKEFLVGHPAFILALALWYRGRKRIALPLFVVGVIGQVSILNTFCHTHTPLYLSFIRDVTGLVFGTVIGLAIFWTVDRMLPQEAEAAALDREPAPRQVTTPALTADG